jgi:hypothetical protein
MTEPTVRDALFGPADPTSALAATPSWQGVVRDVDGRLGPVSTAGRHTVQRELGAAVAALLNLKLGRLLIAGWRGHKALRTAAEHTLARPEASEVVQLAPHHITTTHTPSVDVVLNGAVIHTVALGLTVDIDVDGFLGTVRRGQLVAIQSGRCQFGLALTCAGRDVARKQVGFDPAVSLPLGNGVDLLNHTD